MCALTQKRHREKKSKIEAHSGIFGIREIDTMTLEHQPPSITENLADNVGLTPMVRILTNKSNNGKNAR